MTPGTKHSSRSRQVADTVLEAILPKVSRGLACAVTTDLALPPASGCNESNFVQKRPSSQLRGGKITVAKRFVVNRVVVCVASYDTETRNKLLTVYTKETLSLILSMRFIYPVREG